jgi:hypothetical protein
MGRNPAGANLVFALRDQGEHKVRPYKFLLRNQGKDIKKFSCFLTEMNLYEQIEEPLWERMG